MVSFQNISLNVVLLKTPGLGEILGRPTAQSTGNQEKSLELLLIWTFYKANNEHLDAQLS